MKEEIVNKLGLFLKKHLPFSEESEVIYFMIELRKFLDRERSEGRNNKYSLVRFYADWIAHTEKDVLTPTIIAIMQKIDQSLDPMPRQGNLSFLLLPELKEEFRALCVKMKLPSELADDNNWKNFLHLLSQILVNQPLINPTPAISSFYYLTSEKGYISANIEFTDQRGSINLGGNLDTF